MTAILWQIAAILMVIGGNVAIGMMFLCIGTMSLSREKNPAHRTAALTLAAVAILLAVISILNGPLILLFLRRG